MAQKVQSRPALAVIIEEPLYINGHTYIPESPMEDGRRNIWYNNALIPYSITGTIYAFMGFLSRRVNKSQVLINLFPRFPSYEPLVFVDC